MQKRISAPSDIGGLMSTLRVFLTSSFLLLVLIQELKGQSEQSDPGHQRAETARLEASLPNSSDSLKVRTYAKLYRLYSHTNPTKATGYAQKANNLAYETGDPLLIAGTCMNLANNYERLGKYEEAKELYAESLKNFKRIDDSLGISMCLSNLGVLCNSFSQYEQAIEFYQQSRAISKKIGDDEGVVIAMEAIATNYRVIGQIDSAVHYYSVCLDLFTELDAEEERGVTLSNMGLMFSDYDLFEKSWNYHLKAKEIFTKLNAKDQLALTHKSMGVLLLNKGELDSAMANFERSFELLDSLDSPVRKAEALGHMSEVFNSKGQPIAALSKLKEALQLTDSLYDFRVIAQIHLSMGDAYLLMDDPEQALPYFEKSVQISGKHNRIIDELRAAAKLVVCYRKLGNTERSHYYQQVRSSLFDSLRSESNYAGLMKLQAEYGASAIKLLEKDILLEQEKYRTELAKNEVQETLILALILAVALLSMVFLWFRTRSKVLLRNKILKEREEGILSMINTDQEVRERVARDLHDGLGQILSGFRLRLHGVSFRLKNGQGCAEQELDDLDGLMGSAIEEVRSISYLMMPLSLRKEGLVPAIQEILNNGIDPKILFYSFEHTVQEELIPDQVKVNLYRVCQELVSNTIKHAKASSLDVLLATNEKFIQLVVEDDGIGIDGKIKRSRGAGLSNVKSRVEVLRGTYLLEKRHPNGQITKIKIPL